MCEASEHKARLSSLRCPRLHLATSHGEDGRPHTVGEHVGVDVLAPLWLRQQHAGVSSGGSSASTSGVDALLMPAAVGHRGCGNTHANHWREMPLVARLRTVRSWPLHRIFQSLTEGGLRQLAGAYGNKRAFAVEEERRWVPLLLKGGTRPTLRVKENVA